MAHTMEEKEMAREKKEEKIREAELNKQHTREMNAAEKEVETTRAVGGHPTGQAGAYAAHRTSAAPYNEVTEVPQGAAGVSPIDSGTVTTTEFNPVSGSTTQTRYEPGAGYS